MLKKISLYLLMSMALCAFGQSAKVVQLSDADSANLKSLYDLKQMAERKWEEAQTDIERRYASTWREKPDVGPSYTIGELTGAGLSVRTVNGRCEIYAGAEPLDSDDECLKYWARRHALESKSKREREAVEAAERDLIAKLPKRKVYTPLPGWENGINFSDGFRFIVPKPAPAAAGWNSIYGQFPHTMLYYSDPGINPPPGISW